MKGEMRKLTVCGLLALLAVLPAAAQHPARPHYPERTRQGRSVVMSRQGIVAAENPLAAAIGAQILAEGGNAVDAILATNAAMGVTEPMMNGLGGDLFAIVYLAPHGGHRGRLYGLNASGWSPQAMTIAFLRRHGFRHMPQHGVFSITVPGVVDGWAQLRRRFGTMSWRQILTPAITLARTGFPVPEWDALYWRYASHLRADPTAAHIYLPGGRPPSEGQVFRNPTLARNLQLIAQGGRKAFYDGPLARRIVRFLRHRGSPMTLADFSSFHSQWVQPLSVMYHGWRVFELPPNGQGIAALEMLNLMSRFPLARWGHNSANALQVMIEAKKLAYADLLRYIGDPRFSKIPITGLLSPAYAAQRAKLIHLRHANCDVGPGDPFPYLGDTNYLTAVDSHGNMVSLIQSNYDAFGSWLVAPGTGFVLQDRGALFNLHPGSPNALAGHKRPLHTIIPGFMEKGPWRLSFGIMGGFNPAQAHAQFVSNVVDFHMNIQEALEAPRFTKLDFRGCDVMMEDRIPAAVRAALTARGQKIQLLPPYASAVGGGQAVERNLATGVNYGASDPRKDGEAVPQPILPVRPAAPAGRR